MKQLLARSRYVFYKLGSRLTQNQKKRAQILFERHPDLRRAYNLSMELSNICENTKGKLYGRPVWLGGMKK